MLKCRDQIFSYAQPTNKERRASGCTSQLLNKVLLICLSRQVCSVCAKGWKNIKSNFRAGMKSSVLGDTPALSENMVMFKVSSSTKPPEPQICSAKHGYNWTQLKCFSNLSEQKTTKGSLQAQCFMLGVSIMYCAIEAWGDYLFLLWAECKMVNIIIESSWWWWWWWSVQEQTIAVKWK